jgi:glycosyltransferase involved in cell wall biosynthesis
MITAYEPQKPAETARIAILGTVGVPGRYGGFETLAENLVRFHARMENATGLSVWCSGKDNTAHPERFESADLRYVKLRANGVQSILYDVVSLWQAVQSGHDRILLLGVSGALVLPLIRLISRARIVTNIDGIEWKREKWSRLARAVLRSSEWAAVRFSHEVIADNQAIADHVSAVYRSPCHVIAYGGDHSVSQPPTPELLPAGLPARYALALCRIEPENNVHTILEAWENLEIPLVFVGNWSNSAYGQGLKQQFGDRPNMFLLDPIYDPGGLRAVRDRAAIYVHGHSAGGTNPSLVEMMHFGIPVLAHDCAFNRYSTEERARYFESAVALAALVRDLCPKDAAEIGAAMKAIALQRYTWDQIGMAYFDILDYAPT